MSVRGCAERWDSASPKGVPIPIRQPRPGAYKKSSPGSSVKRKPLDEERWWGAKKFLFFIKCDFGP